MTINGTQTKIALQTQRKPSFIGKLVRAVVIGVAYCIGATLDIIVDFADKVLETGCQKGQRNWFTGKRN